MKKKLFLLLLILGIKTGMSQTIFSLDKKNPTIVLQDFQIEKIKDNRINKTEYFGELYINKGQKEQVKLKNGIENGVFNYFSKYKSANNKTSLLIVINNFTLNETQNRQNIAGEIKINFKAYTIKAGDTLSLCDGRSGGNYTRTMGPETLPNVEQQLQNSLDAILNFLNSFVAKNKSKIEAFAVASQVIIKPYKVKNLADTTYYQQRKVTWDDFLGPINTQSPYGAAIFTSFGFDSKRYVENNIMKVELTPYVCCNKYSSWVKSDTRTEYNLKHEQLHFDICYLMSTKFLEKIKTFHEPTLDLLISRIQYEYLESFRAIGLMQEKYDDESNHSINRDAQLMWQNKIETQIKSVDLKKIIE